MSLKKIAEVQKRKRRFSTGDGVYEGDGYAGSEMGMGYQGGDYGGSGYGGADVGESVSGTAASHAAPATNYGSGKPGEDLMSQAAATQLGSVSPSGYADIQGSMIEALGPQYSQTLAGLGMYGKLAEKFGLTDKAGRALAEMNVMSTPFGGPGRTGQNTARYDHGEDRGSFNDAQPFGGDTPAQTTPPSAPAAGSTGMRQYVWDPQARQYRLANLGAQANPMGYEQGQVFQMAAGGRAPSGISAGMPRFVQGGGTGLSDDVPVTMDDGGQGRLADGEFVVPADVVSGLGGGSSAAGSKMLFDMMERIRQQAHGKSQQIRPVDPQQVLPA